jgi:hypothetical protein
VCVCVCVCDSARTSTGPIIMQNSSKLMTPVPLTLNLCHAFTRNCMHQMLESCLELKFCGRKASMVNVDCQCLCCHVAAYEFLKDTRTRTPKTQPVSRCAVVYEDLFFCQDPIVTLARFRGSWQPWHQGCQGVGRRVQSSYHGSGIIVGRESAVRTCVSIFMHGLLGVGV